MRRVNRIGGGYRPLNRPERYVPENNGNQNREKKQAEQNPGEIEEGEEVPDSPEVPETEDSVIVRRNNLPIVDLRKYNTTHKSIK